MLRTIVAVLLLANVGYFAYINRWLAPLGLVPETSTETQRLQQQQRPQDMVLLDAQGKPIAVVGAEAPKPAVMADAVSTPVASTPAMGETKDPVAVDPMVAAVVPATTALVPEYVAPQGWQVSSAQGVQPVAPVAAQSGVIVSSEPVAESAPMTPAAPLPAVAPSAPAAAVEPKPQSDPAPAPVKPQPKPAPVPAPAPVVKAPPAPAPRPEPVKRPPPAPTYCLQAGVLDGVQAQVWRNAAKGLPSGSWQLQEMDMPSRWMVYIGKLESADAVTNQRAALKALGIAQDRATGSWDPGISLGRYSTEAGAARALADVQRQGVRGARVVVERKGGVGFTVRAPAVSAELRKRLEGMESALSGRSWRSCS